MTLSLRARLLLGTTLAMALILTVSGTLLYALWRASLIAEFDAALGTQARVLTSLVERQGEGIRLEFDARQFPEYARNERPEFFCFWRADGTVIYRSPSLNGADLERLVGTVTTPRLRAAVLPNGRPGRLVGFAFTPRRGDAEAAGRPVTSDPRHDVVLVVGRDTVAIERRLGRLAWLLVGIFGAAILATLGGMAWVVRHLLRPVDRLAGRIAALDADNLARRIGHAGVPAELRPVVERLDDLLNRLETAFAREKAFTADAAHELRTPLAGLRTTMEVALARPRELGQYQESLADCLDICAQMQALVNNLLSLARLEAGKVAATRSALAIADLVEECWRPFAGRAAERGLRLDWRLDRALRVESDREKLRLVLHNLFDNAVSYTDAGGAVRIEVGCEPPAGLRLRVVNTGCAVPAAQIHRVFDRFWRGDAARAATGVHCGIGLSLCQKLVALLGGGIEAAATVAGEFAITVRLADCQVG